jgi:tetratricopeptide (TPR) repeat protein
MPDNYWPESGLGIDDSAAVVRLAGSGPQELTTQNCGQRLHRFRARRLDLSSYSSLHATVLCAPVSSKMKQPTESDTRVQRRDRLRALESLLKNDPANPRLLSDCVELAKELADFEAVLRLADNALAVRAEDRRALSDRAFALIGLRRFRDALPVLQTLHKAEPGNAAVLQDLGLSHYCLAEYAQAVAPLEAAYRAAGASNGLLRLLVSTYHHLGAMDEATALADAHPALALADPALSGVYALAFLDASRASEAGQCSQRALAMDAQCIDALVVEGTLQATRGAPAVADELFERALALAPLTGRAWLGLGTTALLRQDYATALSRLQRAVEQLPSHVGSWHTLAWTQLLSGDLNAAEQTFLHALELNRNFGESHGGLAVIAALRGERSQAQHLIEVALRLDSASLSPDFARAVLAGRAGDPQQARQIVLGMLDRAAPGAAAGLVQGFRQTPSMPH